MENNLKKEEQVDHNKLIDDVIDSVDKNKNKFYFYCPPLNTASGGIAMLIRLAKILIENGYDAKIVYEPIQNQKASYEESVKSNKQVNIYDKFNPEWISFDYSKIPIIPLGDSKIKFTDGTEIECKPLNLKPEDFIFIPEGFPNIMKKTMEVACKRVVIAQSWFYVLNALNAGETWMSFGIQDVISVSDAITDYLNTVMPGLRIKNVSQGIDRELFNVPEKKSDKYPIVGFMGTRGQENRMKTFNIIRTFQAFYPHLRWIRFVELYGLSQKEFAERVKQCAFIIYTDDIAGFGTLPLEAMASGTHVVGWNAYGGKEYANENNGFWTVSGDIFQTAEVLGVAIDKWLNGEMDVPEIQEEYEKTLKRYTNEGEKTQFLNIINELKKERINELTGFKK